MAALAAGCGGEPRPTNPAVTGPHGIPAIPIPGGLGYGEARFESSSEATSGQRETGQENDTAAGHRESLALLTRQPRRHKKEGSGPDRRLFPGARRQDAIDPAPREGPSRDRTARHLANKYIKAYELTNEPRGDDPVASARFASIPFQLPEQRITGRVTAVLGGQEVSFPLVLAGTPIK